MEIEGKEEVEKKNGKEKKNMVRTVWLCTKE
jgi:hypothetical protein